MIRHVLTVALALLLIVGVPVWATGYPQRILEGTDAISAATVVIDQPSGAYVVLINGKHHTDADNLATWEAFFRGEDIGFLFEDISCAVIETDAAGLELARSFQSRLPEHQMRLTKEDATFLLSKADHGIFDVLLFSREAFEAYRASTVESIPSVVVIEADGT